MATRAVFDMGWKSHIITLAGAVGSVGRAFPLNHWFATESIRPSIVGEFEDSALMKVFGQAGVGLFAAPTAIEKQVRQQYGVDVVGRLESVQERFYAISLERKLKHPAVVSIVETAHGEIFD